MADIVNLNRFRKTKIRALKDQRAEQNRVTYGTPKALKTLTAAQKALEDKKHSGKKRHTDEVPPELPPEPQQGPPKEPHE